jgi:hypothetical protein
MISRGLVLEGTPTPASKDRGRNGPRIIVGSSPSMHNRLICASQQAENSRPPAAPIRYACFRSAGACFVRHGGSFPAWPQGNGMAGGPAGADGSRSSGREQARVPV